MRLMAASDDLRFQCYLLENISECGVYQRIIDIECANEGWPHSGIASLFDQLAYVETHDAFRRYECFVLWDAVRKDVIGYTALDIETDEISRFAYSYIEPLMQGQRLAELLYHSRFRLLSERGFSGSVYSEIPEYNERSQRVAERNGFRSNTDLVWNHVNTDYHKNLEFFDLEEQRSYVLEDPKPRVEKW